LRPKSQPFNPNTEVGGTAFAAIIGSTSRRAILDSINWIQPLRSPTSCAAKYGNAYSPSNFGIRDESEGAGLGQVQVVAGAFELAGAGEGGFLDEVLEIACGGGARGAGDADVFFRA